MGMKQGKKKTTTRAERAANARAAVARAAKLCQQRALRFTDLRRRVLNIVCQSAHPPKAYDILRKLGATARPPTVYRALDFLLAHGFLHKIKSRGTYSACGHPHRTHDCYFLLCEICGQCEECCDRRLDGALSAVAARGHFSPRVATVEIEGVCRRCQ